MAAGNATALSVPPAAALRVRQQPCARTCAWAAPSRRQQRPLIKLKPCAALAPHAPLWRAESDAGGAGPGAGDVMGLLLRERIIFRGATLTRDASTGGLLPAGHRPSPPPPSLHSRSISSNSRGGRLRALAGAAVLLGRPLEEVYKVRVERGAAARHKAEALRAMETWSSWRTGGRCRMPWDWQVDQLVYIVSGEVKVLPAGAANGDHYMHFVAGDLVRYPRWFEADLHFDGPYEERYRFLAYGDDN